MMYHQVAVLKAMLNYTWFLKYYPILIKLKKLPQDHRLLLVSISKYYNEYGTKDISVDEAQSYFSYQNPSAANPDGFELLFKQLREIKLENEELVQDILAHVLEMHYCAQISEQADAVAEERTVTAIDKIENLVEEFRTEVGSINAIENDICDLTLEELVADELTGGIPWHLNFLNETLGVLREGTLGHVFARPNAGKTSLAVNIACNAAYQYHKRGDPGDILYLCNEEKVDSIKKRVYTAYCNKTMGWVTENIDAAKAMFQKYGGDRIKMIDGIVHIAQVEKYLRHIMPKVTIIDQGPKVSIYNRDVTGPERLQQLYNMYREKAKKYNTALVTTGQADERSENRKWLKLNNLDGSKVGIPGELDWALGIGYIDTDDGVRYLNIAKKKSGRFGNSAVTFAEETGKFENAK